VPLSRWSASDSSYTVGVEEEFHLVDAKTGELRPTGSTVLDAAPKVDGAVEAELQRSQVETGTPPARALADVRVGLVGLRRALGEAAADAGCRLAASGTHPSAHRPAEVFTDDERYRAIAEAFGPVARQQTVCGCHVHVAVPDRELGIAVLNRVRPWLPVLLALSVNSPFWLGEDSG
jgi:carboxylate-amine ligase